MSYDISFKAKAEGVDAYVTVGACDANITWNVRKIIEKSTGLEWKNCQNNGLCVDVIPKIEAGLRRKENIANTRMGMGSVIVENGKKVLIDA